jgi:segregation and condensation protein A
VEVRAAPKTLEQRIAEVRAQLEAGEWELFSALLRKATTRDELVLTFLALLEMVRTGRILLVQSEIFGEIRVRAA